MKLKLEPFKNLFTQGMVCHESYKDEKGNWLYPDEIKKIDNKNVIKISDKSKVIVGPPESCQNQENTIDPETMIENYGADAVRWFILSDSPLKKMCSGLIMVWCLQINFYKNMEFKHSNY